MIEVGLSSSHGIWYSASVQLVHAHLEFPMIPATFAFVFFVGALWGMSRAGWVVFVNGRDADSE